jgi:hypothetical protein
MREIKLITNCERPPNYLMDIAIEHWLKEGFKPENLIFLVNNISNFDMVEELKNRYDIDAVRVDSQEDIYRKNKCVVWDDLIEYDYGAYHDREAPIINSIQQKLLTEHGVDVVIFLDRDEILWYDAPGGIIELLQNFQEPIIRPRGIEVIQTAEEPSLDLSKSIAEQRKWCRWFPSKSKACITRIPVDWMIGRHGTTCGRWPHADSLYHPELQTHPQSDISEYPNLYLVHFDKIDIDLVYELRLESQTIFKSNNRHTGVIDEDKFTEWFTEAHRETVPERQLYECGDFLHKVEV